jgi:hypothetical protein
LSPSGVKEDPMGRFVQENGRRPVTKDSHKPVRMEYTNLTSAKGTSPEIAHLVVKRTPELFPGSTKLSMPLWD